MTKQNKTTTKKATTKKAAPRKTAAQKSTANMCTSEKEALTDAKGQITTLIIGEDVRTAMLIVSVIINLFFFIAWITLQVTDVYDGEVASLLFDRTISR